jgi:hypothetical protein
MQVMGWPGTCSYQSIIMYRPSSIMQILVELRDCTSDLFYVSRSIYSAAEMILFLYWV